jgi:4a-hydroxytetrahydrobiopterin dehydratase
MTDKEIAEELKSIDPKWQKDGIGISRIFEFKNFNKAFSFMVSVALEVEKADHHPTWENTYGKVKIYLSTHSNGGLTMKDFRLAKTIDMLFI